MRLILASAGIAVLASSGSAMAADCTKGLLWPYVRNPGDCLTDTEIQAGKTGAYNGPVTGQVDVSTIKPPPKAASTTIQCSHSWYWPFGSGDCQPVPGATVSNSTGSGAADGNPAAKDNSPAPLPATQPASAPPAVKPQAAATPPAPPAQPQPVAKPQAAVAPPARIQLAEVSTTECHKGVLWPFVRDNGDCPTSAETGKGNTSAVPIAANPSAAMPVAASGTAPAAQSCTRSWLWPIISDTCVTQNSNGKMTPVAFAMAPVAVAGAPAAAGCAKGAFWPFIRDAGDCPTAAEKANGKTSTAPMAATEPAAMPASVASPPPPPPAMPAVAVASPPVAAGCTKGTFWPFIRDAGDCLTAAEKANGQTSTTPMAATEPAEMPVFVASPPPPPPAMPAVAVASPPVAAGCTKGTFWPFIRDAGDCPTAAERANGQTSAVPTAASAPAPTPVAQTSAAATMASSDTTACGRSWLWPFVRESGDCPTTAEKGTTSTSAVPINASAPAAGPVVVHEAAPPEQTGPAQNSGPPATNPAACHKGLFWPFVREAGDCPTDADRGSQHNPS